MVVEQTQGQWVVTDLVPALTNPATPPQMLGPHWASAQPTLDQLEAGVAELLANAPDDARAAQARAIGGAVTQVRSSAAAHVALVGSASADPTAVATSAAALQTARSQLAAASGQHRLRRSRAGCHRAQPKRPDDRAWRPYCGLTIGNRIVSRMFIPVSVITNRSMPMPWPPVGGMP